MDFTILYAINSIHNAILNKIMVGVTYLGNAGGIWIALAIILLFSKKTRKCGILILVSMLLGVVIGNLIIKNLVARQRPCWIDTSIALLISNPQDYSFPSGHTLASFEAAVMIFLHNKKWGICAITLAILIAFSRLYLFVHFPTDVLGGIALGTIISLLTYFISNKILKSKKVIEE